MLGVASGSPCPSTRVSLTVTSFKTQLQSPFLYLPVRVTDSDRDLPCIVCLQPKLLHFWVRFLIVLKLFKVVTFLLESNLKDTDTVVFPTLRMVFRPSPESVGGRTEAERGLPDP